MSSDTHDSIMTNSESVVNLGANAYAKTATGLNILRETILGRELFDFAFREYSRRWKFKRPTPSDLFRSMEDASGIDLDWFWGCWFYSVDHTDISIDKVRQFSLDTRNPELEKPVSKNSWPAKPVKTPFQLFKEKDPPNPMQLDKKAPPKTTTDQGKP